MHLIRIMFDMSVSIFMQVTGRVWRWEAWLEAYPQF